MQYEFSSILTPYIDCWKSTSGHHFTGADMHDSSTIAVETRRNNIIICTTWPQVVLELWSGHLLSLVVPIVDGSGKLIFDMYKIYPSDGTTADRGPVYYNQLAVEDRRCWIHTCTICTKSYNLKEWFILIIRSNLYWFSNLILCYILIFICVFYVLPLIICNMPFLSNFNVYVYYPVE